MNDLSDDFVDALRWKAVEDLGYSREKIEQNQKIVDVILPLIFADQYDESGYVELMREKIKEIQSQENVEH